MKLIIEIDVPELDTLNTQKRELEDIDQRFRQLLETPNDGLIITQAISLLDRAKVLTANGLPTDLPLKLWAKEIAQYHIDEHCLHQHGFLMEKAKALYEVLRKKIFSTGNIGRESALHNIERHGGNALAQKFDAAIKEAIMNQLENVNHDPEETAIEA